MTTHTLTEHERSYGTDLTGTPNVYGRWYSEAAVERLLAAREAHTNTLRGGNTDNTHRAAVEVVRWIRTDLDLLADTLRNESDGQHVEGCDGQPDCLACIEFDVRRIANLTLDAAPAPTDNQQRPVDVTPPLVELAAALVDLEPPIGNGDPLWYEGYAEALLTKYPHLFAEWLRPAPTTEEQA